MSEESGEKKVALNSLVNFRILLAEDNEINQELVREFLLETGVNVDVAVNGKEALEMIADGNKVYDLVLMDIQMPIMDGYEASRRIRSDCRFTHLPIIAMTAYAMEDARQKILECGIDAHIAKPINAQTLLQTIMFFLLEQDSSRHIDAGGRDGTSDEFEIPEIEGLDVSSALRRLDGNKRLYLRLLTSFAENKLLPVEEIANALRSGDVRLALLKVHTVKGGIAGAIGAVSIEKIALSLENAIRQDASSALVAELLKNLSGEVEHLVAELRKQLPLTSEPVTKSEQGAFDVAVIAPVLSRLLHYITSFDGKAERYLDDYQKELACLPQNEVNRIKTYLNRFEFLSAREALLNLAAKHDINVTINETGD